MELTLVKLKNVDFAKLRLTFLFNKNSIQFTKCLIHFTKIVTFGIQFKPHISKLVFIDDI